jgi:hypothetical protein
MNFYTINTESQNKKCLMCERIQQNTERRDTSMGKISPYRKASPSRLFSPCPWVWKKDGDLRIISGIKIKEMRDCHRVARVIFNCLKFVIYLIFCILCYICCFYPLPNAMMVLWFTLEHFRKVLRSLVHFEITYPYCVICYIFDILYSLLYMLLLPSP